MCVCVCACACRCVVCRCVCVSAGLMNQSLEDGETAHEAAL